MGYQYFEIDRYRVQRKVLLLKKVLQRGDDYARGYRVVLCIRALHINLEHDSGINGTGICPQIS